MASAPGERPRDCSARGAVARGWGREEAVGGGKSDPGMRGQGEGVGGGTKNRGTGKQGQGERQRVGRGGQAEEGGAGQRTWGELSPGNRRWHRDGDRLRAVHFRSLSKFGMAFEWSMDKMDQFSFFFFSIMGICFRSSMVETQKMPVRPSCI